MRLGSSFLPPPLFPINRPAPPRRSVPDWSPITSTNEPPPWWVQAAMMPQSTQPQRRARAQAMVRGSSEGPGPMNMAGAPNPNFSVDLPPPEQAPAPTQPAPTEIAKPPVTEPGYTMSGEDLDENARAFSVRTSRPNLWERIGGALDEPGTRGGLLRSGVSLLTGGNAQPGFDYHERQRRDAADQRRFDLGYGLQERAADRADYTATNSVADAAEGRDIQRGELLSTDRYRRGQLTVSGQRNAIDRQNAVDQVRAGVYNNEVDNRTQRYGYDIADRDSQRDYDASRYGTDAEVYVGTQRAAAGIGSNQPTRRVTARTDGRPAVEEGWIQSGSPEVPAINDVREYPMPGPTAIARLRANPGLREQFDIYYGPGAAEGYLGR